MSITASKKEPSTLSRACQRIEAGIVGTNNDRIVEASEIGKKFGLGKDIMTNK